MKRELISEEIIYIASIYIQSKDEHGLNLMVEKIKKTLRESPEIGNMVFEGGKIVVKTWNEEY